MAEEEIPVEQEEVVVNIELDLVPFEPALQNSGETLAPPGATLHRAPSAPTSFTGSPKEDGTSSLSIEADDAIDSCEGLGVPETIARHVTDSVLVSPGEKLVVEDKQRRKGRKKSGNISALKTWRKALEKRLTSMGSTGFKSSGAEHGITFCTPTCKEFYFSPIVTEAIFKYFSHRELVLNLRGISSHFKYFLCQLSLTSTFHILFNS